MNKIKRKSFHIAKRCWISIAFVIICVALIFSLFRALTPLAEYYKTDLEGQLTKILGHEVVIDSMETTWYWFEPVLKLNHVTIFDPNHQHIKLDKLLVGINLVGSLLHWQIQPGMLYIDDVNLSVRQHNNHWQIDGLDFSEQSIEVGAESYRPLLSWLFAQQKIVINHVSAMIYLNDGSLLPVSDLKLTVNNNSGRHIIKGSAELKQTISTKIMFLADMNIHSYDLSKSRGEAYLSFSKVLPAQWQNFFPMEKYHLDGGQGNLQMWFDFSQGRLGEIQSLLNFKHLAWTEKDHQQNYFLNTLAGNLIWKPNQKGWTIIGDDITTKVGTQLNKNNAFMLDYNVVDNVFDFYAKKIEIAPLIHLGLSRLLPTELKQSDVFGILKDTHLTWKAGSLQNLTTEFLDIGWLKSKTYPGVSHLSGVLSWQPDEGRLDFDSENVVVTLDKDKPIVFSTVNSDLVWKKLSQGFRFVLERLVISRPDLVVSMQGQLNHPMSSPNLRLVTEFSAEEAEQWLDYIPTGLLKQKLEDWLKQDIHRIQKAVGRMTINGALADFPFEKSQGEFSIESIVEGVDLDFHNEWPMAKDIKAFIQVNNRNLKADIVEGNLQGIKTNQLELKVDDLGSDHEALIIEGQVHELGSKALDFIQSTPLNEKLSKLKALKIDGWVNLLLKLDIPLYPERDKLLYQGLLSFKGNDLAYQHQLGKINFDDLSGQIKFSEQGIEKSALTSTVLGDKVNLSIETIQDPKSALELDILGNFSIDSLKKRFSTALFSLIKGYLKFELKLTITDDPTDLDRLIFSSSLQGIGVDLPEPFGKTADSQAPLNLLVNYNPEKAVYVDLSYSRKFSSKLKLTPNKKSFSLERGELRIGSGQAIMPSQTGVLVVGTIKQFDLSSWARLYETLFKKPNASEGVQFKNPIRFVDLEFESAQVLGEDYQNLIIKAEHLDTDDWQLNIKQAHMAAKLFYQTSKNLLSGHFEYLYLPLSEDHKATNEEPFDFSPNRIPNLNLTVDELKVGQFDVGKAIVKSHTQSNHWNLEYCKLLSPVYQMTIVGDWIDREPKSRTKIHAIFKSRDLGKSLQHWGISPVVHARQAEVEFKGGFDGGLSHFSLKNLSGEVDVTLKNGRITHLSQEAQSKIGLGKLLSILSLQTIPRRLTLDFSDLAHEGYSFDIFDGDFILNDGIMKTKNSYIDGPVAYVGIKGELDVIHRLYDLNLVVSPHITASLPVVATIAGGPIAGIATWVASKIINKGMQKISGYTYKISGPWLDPIVQQVSIIKTKPAQ